MTDRCFISMPVEIAARGHETQGRSCDEQSAEMQAKEEEGAIKHIAVIDSGIRTFVTLYDPERDRIVEWGMHCGHKDWSHSDTELLG